MRWTITGDKFLNLEQVSALIESLLNRRDLALARRNDKQGVRDYYMVRTLLESGLRVFEFCDLRQSDFQGQKLTVRHGKGGKPRTVLLTKATSNMLKEWIAIKPKLGFSIDLTSPLFPSRFNSPYTTRGAHKRIKIIFATIGLPKHLSVHSLRHTYCSLLLASGKVGITTVKENLGHHSIAVTNLYAHAVGRIEDDVELYMAPSSENFEYSELPRTTSSRKSNVSTPRLLRSRNFKHMGLQ